MFFEVEKIRKNIEALYKTLTKKGGIPERWWSWDQNQERFFELSEEDESLVEDIVALYEHARLVGRTDLVKDMEKTARALAKHLTVMQEELASGEQPGLELQEAQKEILEKMIARLQESFRQLEQEERRDEAEERVQVQDFVKEHTQKVGKKTRFVFYRAEHLADRPRLDEDVGQLGRGVYFAVTKDVAKRFRSKPSCIFIFFVDPKVFVKKLNPIFITREEMEQVEHMDPLAFQEYLAERGYGESSSCVIAPIPEFGYVTQIMVQKEALESLLEEQDVQWDRGEEFNV